MIFNHKQKTTATAKAAATTPTTETNPKVNTMTSQPLVTPTKQRLHLRLHASNLSRHGVMLKNPDTYAIVSAIEGRNSPNIVKDYNDDNDHHYHHHHNQDNHVLLQKARNHDTNNNPITNMEELGRTEIVYKSCNPQWTKTFILDYEYGSECYFFVQVFRFASNTEPSVPLGNVVCEISDILGTKYNTKVKRLPTGGVIHTRIEPIQPKNEKQFFRFRMAGKDLLKNKEPNVNLFGSSKKIYPPDTVLEIQRQQDSIHGGQYSSQWTTIYRSKPVLNSFDPSWDVGQINLASCCNGDLDLPLRFYVMKYKKNSKNAMIGMCETTLRVILNTQRDYERTELEQEQRKNGFCLSDSAKSKSSSKNVDSSTRSNHSSSTSSSSTQQQGEDYAARLQVILAQVINEEGGEDMSLIPEQQEEVQVHAEYREERNTTTTNFDNTYERPDDGAVGRTISNLTEDDPYTVDIATIPAPIAAPATFQDYVDDGCQIDFCVAIDYTSSNGDPRIPGTLHDQSSDTMNDYEEVITSVGTALTMYSDEFSVWGFGAKFDGITRHLFQCGSSATSKGVGGILDAYKTIFQSDLIMSGPTVFDQVLQAAAVRAKGHEKTMAKRLRYTVLLIITDGIMDERGMEETKRKLSVYSTVPLSIIFVGLGRTTDFRSMHALCNDDTGSRQRNATTVVEFRQHQYDPFALGKAALQNVPNQIVEYMLQNGIRPK